MATLLEIPSGFWSGLGPWAAGTALAASLWAFRGVMKSLARASDLDGLRLQHDALNEKLDDMHRDNQARLAAVEEAQKHMPSRHDVANMGQRIGSLELQNARILEGISWIKRAVNSRGAQIPDDAP